MPLIFKASLFSVVLFGDGVPRGRIFASFDDIVVIFSQSQKYTRQLIISPALWAAS
jgi:hypothetical protein